MYILRWLKVGWRVEKLGERGRNLAGGSFYTPGRRARHGRRGGRRGYQRLVAGLTTRRLTHFNFVKTTLNYGGGQRER